MSESKEFSFSEVHQEFPSDEAIVVLVELLNGSYDIEFIRKHLRNIK